LGYEAAWDLQNVGGPDTKKLAEEKDSALLRRTDRPETSGTYRLKTTPINRGEKFKCVILPTANAPKSGTFPGLHPVMIAKYSEEQRA
jgi:hypothetical protein